MPRLNESDFPPKVKRELADRVNGRCSKPDCRVPTRGPQLTLGSKTLGDAAHITSAAPGGKRYDPTLTPEERRSPANGIWLCKNHAWEVDHDEDRYPVDLIRSWKKTAEALAQQEYGQRQPTQDDIAESVHQLVTGAGSRFVPNLLATAVHSTVKQLNRLDERFSVTPEFRDGHEAYIIKARQENVSVRVSLHDDDAPQFERGIQDLKLHATPFEISLSGLNISGSPLLETIGMNSPGKFRLEPTHKIPSELSLRPENSGDPSKNFAHLLFGGHTSVGSESFTFSGTALNGLLCVCLRCPLAFTPEATINLTYSVNLDPWNGKPIADLPCIAKLLQVIRSFARGDSMNLEFEINGLQAFSTAAYPTPNSDEWKDTVTYVRAVTFLSIICRYIDSSVLFDWNEIRFDRFNYEHIYWAARVIENGGRLVAATKGCTATGPAEVTEHFLSAITGGHAEHSIGFLKTAENFKVGGQSIVLPELVHRFSKAKLRMDFDVDRVALGDSIDVTWEIGDGIQEISLISRNE